jgi:hypothetical protein
MSQTAYFNPHTLVETAWLAGQRLPIARGDS